ncbi:diguanylate phosphodiesterase [Devosia soli]|uniref:Diguanylate phosphodiesterase n=1 Tax=Devosia soli TaxID=361041 RepID=A0A0F5LCI6_9HYPH|nr:EAL domain-containing protein [Devosia soli]KKB79914.1 diguanylate phosphodiesterase [Devosia soli]
MGASCEACRNGESFPVPFTMAFQPIVDVSNKVVWGYEALVRGADGQGAASVLSAVTDANRYVFDQACRVKAIELAGTNLPVSSTARLSINFMPNAVYEPRACIRATLGAAARVQFDPKRLMFEFTENERMPDVDHVANIVAEYKRMGFMTALDDFGAGYAGLGLLAKFQPDLIKIDMELLRDVNGSAARQAIIAGIVGIARQLDILVLAEGVETEAELMVLHAAGIDLFQGYYFAKPRVEMFEAPTLSLAA